MRDCKLQELERWSSQSIELDVASPTDDIREHTPEWDSRDGVQLVQCLSSVHEALG